MPRHLTGAELARYRAEGALFPLRALGPEEAGRHLRRLEAVEAAGAGRLAPAFNAKAHLLLPWLWELVHDARILDPVEDLLGPDLLCWAASFFNKGPGEPHHVPWHQDATYWGLSEPEAVTVWVAFTRSHPGNGGMRVVPGTHRAPLSHGDTGDRFNMLAGRERVLAPVDEAAAVEVVLEPGEMSLHHVLLVHGSPPNGSGERRVGFAIRYIPARLTQRRGGRATATLVRGRDHGHFGPEQAPEGEFHPAAMGRYRAVLRRWVEVVAAESRLHRGGTGDR